MKDDQKEIIIKYLLNSTRFMFDLIPKLNKGDSTFQSTVYDWLHKQGFEFTRAKYSEVTKQLIRYPGIEGVIQKLADIVKEQFPEETLKVLRDRWDKGERPSYEDIKNLKVNHRGYKDEEVAFTWRPFLEINYLPKSDDKPSSKYVERWGEFAPVWFLFLEPWLKESTKL